jgi:hypothetical protein
MNFFSCIFWILLNCTALATLIFPSLVLCGPRTAASDASMPSFDLADALFELYSKHNGELTLPLTLTFLPD